MDGWLARAIATVLADPPTEGQRGIGPFRAMAGPMRLARVIKWWTYHSSGLCDPKFACCFSHKTAEIATC